LLVDLLHVLLKSKDDRTRLRLALFPENFTSLRVIPDNVLQLQIFYALHRIEAESNKLGLVLWRRCFKQVRHLDFFEKHPVWI
jgi:hypothetical protein